MPPTDQQPIVVTPEKKITTTLMVVVGLLGFIISVTAGAAVWATSINFSQQKLVTDVAELKQAVKELTSELRDQRYLPYLSPTAGGSRGP